MDGSLVSKLANTCWQVKHESVVCRQLLPNSPVLFCPLDETMHPCLTCLRCLRCLRCLCCLPCRPTYPTRTNYPHQSTSSHSILCSIHCMILFLRAIICLTVCMCLTLHVKQQILSYRASWCTTETTPARSARLSANK